MPKQAAPKEFVELICSGCTKLFQKDKRIYTREKAWGKSVFYCKGRCANLNRKPWSINEY